MRGVSVGARRTVERIIAFETDGVAGKRVEDEHRMNQIVSVRGAKRAT